MMSTTSVQLQGPKYCGKKLEHVFHLKVVKTSLKKTLKCIKQISFSTLRNDHTIKINLAFYFPNKLTYYLKVLYQFRHQSAILKC